MSAMRFLIEIMVILNAIKFQNPILKRHMIDRILRSWSFHIEFMKLADVSFDKFHMK